MISSYKKLRKTVEDAIRDSVRSMRTVNRLDNIHIKSIKADSWGDTPIYAVKGHVEVQVKTGFFSTKPGKKAFTATAKAETGEILAINWEPGKTNQTTRKGQRC
ncbi:MAG: hypothetical protein ACFFDP_08000 [Promethearchaeota archaeon]